MTAGRRRSDPGERPTPRAIKYCLIPPERATALHGKLREHFALDPAVEVVVERRGLERRAAGDRRTDRNGRAEAGDRRRIRSPSGRRAGERRAPVIDLDDFPSLPSEVDGEARRLAFVERLEPSSEHAEDIDTARLVTRFQDGDDEAFTDLYIRYFDRVYAYLQMLLRDAEAAEEATHTAFVEVLEGLRDFERGRQPFRAWLFAAVRRAAMSHLRRLERDEVQDPLHAGSELERAAHEDGELFALHWITDRDLLLLVEHLPPAQRQVLLLRYMLDLPSSQVAEVVGRSRQEVRELQERALRLLRDQLQGIESGQGEPELPTNNVD